MFSWHSTHTRFAHFISLDFFRLLFHKSTMEWISLIAVLISCSLIGRVILLMSYFAYSLMTECNKFLLQVLNITTKMLEFHTSSQPLRWRLASIFVQIELWNFLKYYKYWRRIQRKISWYSHSIIILFCSSGVLWKNFHLLFFILHTSRRWIFKLFVI